MGNLELHIPSLFLNLYLYIHIQKKNCINILQKNTYDNINEPPCRNPSLVVRDTNLKIQVIKIKKNYMNLVIIIINSKNLINMRWISVIISIRMTKFDNNK